MNQMVCRTISLAALVIFAACGGDGDPPTGPGPNPNPNPEPDLGHIQVSTTTSGADLDPDGYTVAMPGAAGRPIGLNGVTTFSDVEVGTHQVELSGLADNCSANGSNPATAAVTAGETAQVAFDVECEAFPIGSLEVTTTVTNNFDPDGFQVLVGGANQGTVAVNGSATFDDLSDGAQQVELTGIAPNCEVDGDNPVTVTIPAGGSTSADFSITCTNPPDGRILYLIHQQGAGNFFTIMNADGSGSFTLMGHPGATTPSWGTWSPDGSMIAFSSDVNAAPGEHDIYVMNKDGSGLTQLTTDPASERGPAWSPDGTRLAFNRDVGLNNDFEIFVVNLDGSDLQQLTDDPELSSASPSWSPDGSKIVFWQTDLPGDKDGDNRLSVMNADGSDVTRINQPAPICDQGFNIGFPAWSDYAPKWEPGGSRILFQRQFICTGDSDTDETHVFIMNTDGTDILELTPGPEEATQPRWSPDGAKVIYRAGDWANGSYTALGIWTMNPDGTAVTQISQDGSYPDWGP